VPTFSRPGCSVPPTDSCAWVLTFDARTEEDAVEQAMAVFERAADRLFVTDPGVLAAEVWKASDTPPEQYQGGLTKPRP
jgi:hypothetical protein